LRRKHSVCLLIDHSVYCIRRLLKVLLSAPLLPNCSFTLVTLLLFSNVAACARARVRFLFECL